MPLVSLEFLESDLVCPRCRQPFTKAAQSCASCGLELATINGVPILVDFECSVLDRDSLLETSAESPVARGQHGELKAWVLKTLHGKNGRATEQLHTLVARAKQLRNNPSILVVGGGAIGSGLKDFYSEPGINLIGFDIYSTANVQFVADAHQIPLRDECVDAVIIQAVLEHVMDPQAVVAEIRRVLRKGGIVYADTPFLQQVHEGPYDFTRFTESGHRYLFRDFEEISSGAVGGLGTQTLWSLDYLARGVFRSRKAGQVARLLFFWLRWLDRMVPEAYSMDGASGCFFLGSLSSRRLTPKELIMRYQGAQRV